MCELGFGGDKSGYFQPGQRQQRVKVKPPLPSPAIITPCPTPDLCHTHPSSGAPLMFTDLYLPTTGGKYLRSIRTKTVKLIPVGTSEARCAASFATCAQTLK